MSGHLMNLRSSSRNNSQASATSEAAALADALHTHDTDAKHPATVSDVPVLSSSPAVAPDSFHALETRLIASQRRNDELLKRLERLLASQLHARVDTQPHIITNPLSDGSPLGLESGDVLDGSVSPLHVGGSRVRPPQTPGPHSVVTRAY